MRITASWFGSLGPPNTRTRHDLFVRDTRAPLQSSFRSQHACRCARSRQGQACGGRRRAASPDRSCARRLIDRVGRDEETGFQVEQRNRNERKKNAVNLPLDFPSPIQGFSDACITHLCPAPSGGRRGALSLRVRSQGRRRDLRAGAPGAATLWSKDAFCPKYATLTSDGIRDSGHEEEPTRKAKGPK